MSGTGPSETPQQMRERFLRSAHEAEALAKSAPTTFHHDMCLFIAKYWRQMANDIDEKD